MKFPEQFRKGFPRYPSKEGDPFGVFVIPNAMAPKKRQLNVIACDGVETGWEHISVSVGITRIPPSWEEMCFVKDLFWNEDECVVQFHPTKSDYINIHAGVLHMWKCVNQQFPMPPKIFV